MDVLYKVCCGLDVHKKKLVACLKKKGKKDVIKEFGEETKDIEELAEWLKENKCEKVAMESTASYWKPLWNIFEIKEVPSMVINAKDYKNVPGKKTDVADSVWIADLLQHGLLKESFVPTREQRELREAVRYRKSLTGERARELNRLQKMLEGANIKISSVLTNYYAQYQRLSTKRGKNRAKVAVAHSMLISIYYMIKENKEYKDLGAEFYNKFNKEKKANSYIKKLKELGYNIQIENIEFSYLVIKS